MSTRYPLEDRARSKSWSLLSRLQSTRRSTLRRLHRKQPSGPKEYLGQGRFSRRSDYQPFISPGISAVGLFTGAEAIKTGTQVSIWGGTAGTSYDPFYHRACDTLDNVSTQALEVNIDAIAYAIYNLAATTEAVNGLVGVEPSELSNSPR
ncbi:MAG: M28 family peptidase [Acidimicrobiaceae bacterium]|nr:M28 family peptidase [Acidimicrobiaceae bacterium]